MTEENEFKDSYLEDYYMDELLEEYDDDAPEKENPLGTDSNIIVSSDIYEMGWDENDNPVCKRNFPMIDNYPPSIDTIEVEDAINSGEPAFKTMSLCAWYCDKCDDKTHPKRRIEVRIEDYTESEKFRESIGERPHKLSEIPQSHFTLMVNNPEEAEKIAKWFTAAAKWMKEKKDTDWIGLRHDIQDAEIKIKRKIND